MGLIYAVTTCRESAEVIRHFVAANLAAGADHVFVFLDEPDPQISAELSEEPNATGIVTDQRYWRGHRPESVNARQKINANLIRTLLAPLEWADWLFHLDADETLHLDRSVLATLPSTVRAVRLQPWEAVSTERPGWDGWYKRLLDSNELALLHLLGELADPHNATYFHGHHLGKVGVRPSLDLALEIHHATVDGAKLPLEKHPSLCHLHDDAPTEADFVRKWSRHAGGSDSVNFKPARRLLRNAVRAVLDSPLEPAQRAEVLGELYRRTTVDPVDRLHRLGLLTTVDPAWHQHRPQPHTPDQATAISGLLDALRQENPNIFRPGRGLRAQAAALARAAGRVADPRLTAAVVALPPPESPPESRPEPRPAARPRSRSKSRPTSASAPLPRPGRGAQAALRVVRRLRNRTHRPPNRP